MAGHYVCTKHVCWMYAVLRVCSVNNEKMCCLQEAGKRLHIDPILCNALFLLPSLCHVDQGDVGLRVDYPLKGIGSAGALDYAILFVEVPTDANRVLRLQFSLNASELV